MAVTNSSLIPGHAQIDGRRWVRETHALAVGAPVIVDYIAAGGADYAAIMTARVAAINAQLQSQEAQDRINAPGWSALQEQTLAEFAARYWAGVQAAFAERDLLKYCRLLWWLEERLVAGVFTDAQARTSFNTSYERSINAAQWTALRAARIIPAHDRYAAILAETDL